MLRIILVAAFCLAGSASAGPYGPPPRGRTPELKPPTHRPPGTPPGVPQDVLHRNQPGGEEPTPEERIEAARAREHRALAEVQAAMAELEEAEARERRAHQDRNDALDRSDPEYDSAWLDDAEDELWDAQQEMGELDDRVETLLGEYRDAEQERRSLEGLGRDSAALGDILEGAADGSPVTPELPSVAGAPEPEAPPEPTPEQKAHDAYRKALDAFANGEASFGDVESAYVDLQMARDDAGW